jgi:hypothetical protein
MLKEDCAICDRLKRIREIVFSIANDISKFVGHRPRKEQAEFGIHISSTATLDKAIIKLIQQHETYHEMEDSSLSSEILMGDKIAALFSEKDTKSKKKKKRGKKSQDD